MLLKTQFAKHVRCVVFHYPTEFWLFKTPEQFQEQVKGKLSLVYSKVQANFEASGGFTLDQAHGSLRACQNQSITAHFYNKKMLWSTGWAQVLSELEHIDTVEITEGPPDRRLVATVTWEICRGALQSSEGHCVKISVFVKTSQRQESARVLSSCPQRLGFCSCPPSQTDTQQRIRHYPKH